MPIELITFLITFLVFVLLVIAGPKVWLALRTKTVIGILLWCVVGIVLKLAMHLFGFQLVCLVMLALILSDLHGLGKRVE